MNKAAKTVLKGQLQKRKLDEIAFTAVSKLSLEQVHEKRKLKVPEMAKKLCSVRQALRSACVKFFFVDSLFG